jgi:pimeloyl-ACP methyl ester carboxylesterase
VNTPFDRRDVGPLGFATDSRAKSDTLIVCLSSYGADGDPPTKHFEWRGLLNGLPDQPHLLLLRDLCQHWYLGGLLNLSCSLRETAQMVRAIASRQGAQRIITFGSSMGGFGALLLGALVDADEAVAIAPQTNLTTSWRATHGDDRWQAKMEEINAIGYQPLDLKPVLAESGMRARIFLDGSEAVDVAHADHVRESAEIIDVGCGGHVCAGYMHESGLARQALIDAMNRQHPRSLAG